MARRLTLDELAANVRAADVDLPIEVEALLGSNGDWPSEQIEDGRYRLAPLDWEALTRDGIPQVEYLDEPYVPATARIWAWGPAEAKKSMWALDLACRLTREGRVVVYVSQENPLAEDVRRLSRFRPDWTFLRFFHDQGLDLVDPAHREALFYACEGVALAVFDTITSSWSGDGEKNAEIARLDRETLVPLTKMGTSALVIDHTGHPQAFVSRQGISAGRGASSKGQKADVVLEFRPGRDNTFSIVHAKNRMGGVKAPKTTFMVVDTEDEGLAIVKLGQELDIQACADRMVEAIGKAGSLTTRALRETVGGGKQIQNEAMELLTNEEPARAMSSYETVETPKGRQRGRVWRLSEAVLAL